MYRTRACDVCAVDSQKIAAAYPDKEAAVDARPRAAQPAQRPAASAATSAVRKSLTPPAKHTQKQVRV